MKRWIIRLENALYHFYENGWAWRRRIVFFITAFAIGMTTVCLAGGTTPMMCILGGFIGWIYYCWYEAFFRFWNSHHYQSVYYFADVSSAKYVSCPIGTIAILGVVSLTRPLGLGWRLLGIIAILLGLSMLGFWIRLAAKMLERYEDANEIISTMCSEQRVGHDIKCSDLLREEINKYTTTYFGQEFVKWSLQEGQANDEEMEGS